MDFSVQPNSADNFVKGVSDVLQKGQLHKLSANEVRTIKIALDKLAKDGEIDPYLLRIASEHLHKASQGEKLGSQVRALFQDVFGSRVPEKEIAATLSQASTKLQSVQEMERGKLILPKIITEDLTNTYAEMREKALNGSPALKALLQRPTAENVGPKAEKLLVGGKYDELKQLSAKQPKGKDFNQNLQNSFSYISQLGKEILTGLDGKLASEPEKRTLLIKTYNRLCDELKGVMAPYLGDRQVAKLFATLQGQRAELMDRETPMRVREGLPGRALESIRNETAALKASAQRWQNYSNLS